MKRLNKELRLPQGDQDSSPSDLGEMLEDRPQSDDALLDMDDDPYVDPFEDPYEDPFN